MKGTVQPEYIWRIMRGSYKRSVKSQNDFEMYFPERVGGICGFRKNRDVKAI